VNHTGKIFYLEPKLRVRHSEFRINFNNHFVIGAGPSGYDWIFIRNYCIKL